jgi:hypothetical protein
MNKERIMGNNRIPPRLRSRCRADSPQRGEYRSLSGYQTKCDGKADLLRDGSNELPIYAAFQPIRNNNKLNFESCFVTNPADYSFPFTICDHEEF